MYHLEKLKIFNSALEIRTIFYKQNRVCPKESKPHDRLYHNLRKICHMFITMRTLCCILSMQHVKDEFPKAVSSVAILFQLLSVELLTTEKITACNHVQKGSKMRK